MARKKGKQQPRGLTKESFFDFVRVVSSLRQDLADANMAHASQWQKADTLGIHAQAAKLFCRLSDMEILKRADFLRSFDQMRAWSDWDAQGDMIDQAEANLAADVGDGELPGDLEIGAGEDGDEQAERDEQEVMAREASDPEPVVEADGLDEEEVAAANEELAGAALVFAEGRQAAVDGASAETNPHPHDSASHPIWARGHAQGLRDKEIAETVPGEIVPPAPKRGSRRKAEGTAAPRDADEPASIH